MAQRDEPDGGTAGGAGGRSANVGAVPPTAASADALLETIRRLIDELEPGGPDSPKQSGQSTQSDRADRSSRSGAAHSARARRLRLDSSLGGELGLDSLGRAELIGRIEARFDVTLPDRVLVEAETPRDLLRALEAAPPAERVASLRAPASAVAAPPEAIDPRSAATLIEAADLYATVAPSRRHVLFLDPGPGEGAEHELTYADLVERSRRTAAALQALGLEPGQRVGVMLPTCLEYFAVFLGIQRAGGVPVPMYPPMRASQVEEHLRRQAAIMASAGVRLLVTFEQVRRLAGLAAATVPSLDRVVTAAALDGDPAALVEPPVPADATAFLQYTSGSTGTPKGVVLSHANLLANLRSMTEVLEVGGDDVIVSWLPLYHDMGLIGAWMGSLYFGVPLVLMSPLSFLNRPVRWLRAIDRYRGTLSAAPNFAYELCTEKLSDDEVAGLDLSSWRLALNGAEPVSPRAVERFPERFAAQGLSHTVMMPVYGLAESSLAVSFTPPGRGPLIDTVDRRRFQDDGVAEAVDRVEPAGAGDSEPLRFVSCGRPIPGHEVRFVDDGGRPVGERTQGRLQFRGPSVTAGYFENPEATAALMARDGWRDSGDLGYLADGEVYLTGRRKDLIIRAGRNIHPQEVEDVVGDVDGVRRGCVAAFAVCEPGAGNGEEHLVVMAETRLPEADEAAREALRERVRAAAADVVGLAPDRVVLVPPRTVPKTSSGKIRRAAARHMVETGALEAPGRALWWQVTRLALAGVIPRLRDRLAGLSARAYGLWFWAVLALVAPPVLAVVWALPVRALRRRFVRASVRWLARATGTAVRVSGLERLGLERLGKEREGDGAAGPWVFVANHASYLDGLVLAAALPSDAAYVVKSELRRRPLVHLFLRRLGCVFVERFDPSKGEEESAKAARALARGDHLVIFPEGTLRPMAGLQRFRMGAFVIAARTGTPVVPVEPGPSCGVAPGCPGPGTCR